MEKPLVSLVVPVYNGEKYILKCLSSIVNQTYKNIEIIIVNDGSTDNTLELINNFSLNHDNIKIINKTNTGVSNTRNIGIDVATGAFLMFVDADDWIEKETVENCIDNIGNYDLLRFLEWNVTEKNKKLNSCKYNNTSDRIIKPDEMFDDLLKDKIPGHCCCFFYRLSIFRKNNLHFNNNLVYCEDLVFLLNLLNCCNDIKFLNKPFYNYFKGNDNSATSSTENRIRNLKTLPLIRENIINTFPEDKKELYTEIYNYTILRLIRHYYAIFAIELSFYEFKKVISQINEQLIKVFVEIDIKNYNIKWKIFIKYNIKNKFWVLFILLRIYHKKKKRKKK